MESFVFLYLAFLLLLICLSFYLFYQYQNSASKVLKDATYRDRVFELIAEIEGLKKISEQSKNGIATRRLFELREKKLEILFGLIVKDMELEEDLDLAQNRSTKMNIDRV